MVDWQVVEGFPISSWDLLVMLNDCFLGEGVFINNFINEICYLFVSSWPDSKLELITLIYHVLDYPQGGLRG